ncbi:MAG: glycosyltransferase family 4 protein [Chloroflexota bacterium]
MKQTNITPENTVFIILSFEGPDLYSLAGGLGVRVTQLGTALAQTGFPTQLFFVGDPRGKGEESLIDRKFILHRWCQWISEYYPNGVYQGENEKLYDFNESAPPFIVEHIARPAVATGKLLVVLGEEWHTAEAVCRLSDQLRDKGIRDRAVLFWNANNTFGFDRINWHRLAATSIITTVSRYMKQIMRDVGVNPLVIPNGIPKSLLRKVDATAAARIRSSLEADLILTKVGRWHPDKRWLAAVEAAASLKTRGMKTVLLARGGIEPHGEEVLDNARSLGLTIRDIAAKGSRVEDYLSAVGEYSGEDILNIRSHCSQDFLRLLYHASDAVLANSSHEPFGLVGLEAMAAGGIAFTGGSGEDYAIPFHNSIVLETAEPEEIEDNILYLKTHPAEAERIRQAAKQTARLFTWEEVIRTLVQKLEHQARTQKLLALPETIPDIESLTDEYPEKPPPLYEPKQPAMV